MRVSTPALAADVFAEERGAVLVWFALCLPVLVLVMAFVGDVANWYVHKRHLQLQADAGALAGGGAFTFPCADGPIDATARRYAGDPNATGPYNLQVGGANQGSVHVLINSGDFWDKGGSDYSDGGGPCETKRVDVKVTEANLPLFFKIPGLFSLVPAVNARARVEIRALSYLSGGALPIAVPDVDPRHAKATFVDEETGTLLATTPLTNSGTDGGLAIWDNAAAPVSVPISSSRIGVRITLGGHETSTACGDPLVDCYDAGSADGVVYIRGFSSGGSGVQPNPPLARDVTLIPGSCTDPYFTSASSTCTIGVSADVDFGVADPSTIGATVSATVDGRTRPLRYDAAAGRWESVGNNFFDVDPAVGPLPVTLSWEVRNGTIGGQSCRCTGTFGTVQRVFSADENRSGPLELVQVSGNGIAGANSLERGTTQQLVVTIGMTPTLQNARDVNDPIVTLRVVGGSRNQSLDCEPPNYPGSPISKTNLSDELAYGCSPGYTVNTGTACPDSPTSLWSSPEPWNCVAVQTGSATNQVPRGLNLRILGDEKPATCTSPNNWSLFPFIPAGDPRVLNVFITPFGSFSGSGSGVVPVTKLGTFYVTGWTASGSGFRNPCQGNGDDPVPGGDAGNIVGHFIKYIFGLNDGGGSTETCDFSSFGSCIAVLTE
jgi:Putative Flp pilus-assembly TadE/G-like